MRGLHQGMEHRVGRVGVGVPGSGVVCTDGVQGGHPGPHSSPASLLGGSSASSRCPAPSRSPLRTYQQHEDDGALVNIVHQVAGLLAKPAPAKMGWL